MKVTFHSRLLTERGSEGAMLDYARLNRSVLGNESILCLPNNPEFVEHPIFKKWQEEFPILLYRSKHELGRKLEKEGVAVLYLTKPGPWDGFLVPGIKNCIHAQFLCDEFHGDAYAYLSPWMSRVMTGREDSYVPFFVPRLESGENLRTRLKIPATAKVFGRHGGWDTFNIPFVRRAVAEHALRHPGDHFVFLNTDPIPGTRGLTNVHYLPGTVDMEEKARFLATCDAMLHARWHGETFGLAVAEFAVLGKPVFTFGGSRERAHLELLGDCGRVYESQAQLEKMLANFQRDPGRDCPYGRFAEESTVMDYFQRKFLQTT
jgi:hypothetical protein